MRVSILAAGSRGDIEPVVALARGLVRAGHAVRVATHDVFESVVAGVEADFLSLPGDPRAALAGPEGQAMLAARNPVSLVRRMRAVVAPALVESHPVVERACADADLVLHGALVPTGAVVAEALGVPAVAVHLAPSVPTRAYPPPGVDKPVPTSLNRLAWRVTTAVTRRVFQPVIADFRAEAGLPAAPRPERRVHGYSPAVVPVPDDWTDEENVTGYWFTAPDPDYQPPRALLDFLAAGEPPVYLGLGSMSDGDPARAAALLIDAARAAGRRIVLLAGWADLTAAGNDVAVVDDVPHWWLFPRMAAVVHHGGAGTTAAALRAGVPAVVIPFFADQFFWAHRVNALNAGVSCPPLSRLTPDTLVAALREALTRTAAPRAIASRLADEDGVGTAVTVLERLSEGHR
jgi:sterol 3beta-glucosyltransferase